MYCAPPRLHRLCALLLVIAATAQAQSVPERSTAAEGPGKWRLSGFGTVGMVHSDIDQPWQFARENTQHGAGSPTSLMPDSRLGLQVNWQPHAQWEAVAQAVFRERARDTNLDEYLELGFVAFRPAAGWTLRAGRLKPDLFLLHNVRDVGYSLPWVRPNVEFYGWIPSASLNGAAVAYQWDDSTAQWAAQLWFGEMRNTVGALRTDEFTHWKGRNTYGITLTRAADRLTLKASYLRSETDLGSSPDLLALEGALDTLGQLPLPQIASTARALYRGLIPDGPTEYFGLGAEYDSSTWLASAELSRVSMARGLSGGTRGYISVGRRWGPLTGYLMAGFTQPQHAAPRIEGDWASQLTPLLGSSAAAQLAMAASFAEAYAADSRFDQHSVSAGLRWEALDTVALKLQLDHFRVDAYGASHWRHSTNDAGRANLLSASVDWVF